MEPAGVAESDGRAGHVSESPQEAPAAVVAAESLRPAPLPPRPALPHGPEPGTLPAVAAQAAIIVALADGQWRIAGTEPDTFHL